MKFKKGDMVRVKRNSSVLGGVYARKLGIIIHISKVSPYPYMVKFNDAELDEISWHANELEKED